MCLRLAQFRALANHTRLSNQLDTKPVVQQLCALATRVTPCSETWFQSAGAQQYPVSACSAGAAPTGTAEAVQGSDSHCRQWTHDCKCCVAQWPATQPAEQNCAYTDDKHAISHSNLAVWYTTHQTREACTQPTKTQLPAQTQLKPTFAPAVSAATSRGPFRLHNGVHLSQSVLSGDVTFVVHNISIFRRCNLHVLISTHG